MDRLNKEKIHVEICPTSNLAVCTDANNMVNALKHLKYLHGLDHSFTICTDDTMLFSTNISTELFEFAKGFDVSAEALKQMMLKSCESIFAEDCKEWLREKITKYRA